MRSRIITIALIAAVLGLGAALWAWAAGTAPPRPSEAQAKAFGELLRREAAPGYAVPLTLEGVDVVFGRTTGSGPWSGLIDTYAYQYAATWKLNSANSKWVEIYPVDATGGDVAAQSSELDTVSVAVIAAFNRLTGQPLRGVPDGGLDGEADASSGTRTWEVTSFAPGNGQNYFYGDHYVLKRTASGEFTVVAR